MNKTEEEILIMAGELLGRTLSDIQKEIKSHDESSRLTTKGKIGHLIEEYFDVKINSSSAPDLEHLGIEIKTCPLKYNKNKTRLSVKEAMSLNMVNYHNEVNCEDIINSSLYNKNRKTLIICYIHNPSIPRSEYKIKYVFLFEMTAEILDELRPDYDIILNKIKSGEATDLREKYNTYLTTCPKHSGTFKDSNCKKSKRSQPFSEILAERKAFRFKHKYLNLIISRQLNKKLDKGGWLI